MAKDRGVWMPVDFNELHRYTRTAGKQAAEVFHGGTLGEGMRAAFIDEDGPRTGAAIKHALDEDMAIVLVAADGSARILHAQPVG